jgi:cytoskeletal protein RodZ
VSPNSHSKETKSFLHHPASLKLSVAELLHKRRIELGKDLKNVETATHIRIKYLERIEAGDYEHLPDDVYTLGYIKSYADYLGLETTPIVNMYKKERAAFAQAHGQSVLLQKASKLGLKPVGKKGFAFTSKSLLVLFGFLVFLLIVVYFGWQITILASPPSLQINSLQEKTTNGYIIVSGQVDGGADVFINDSPILTNPDGSFSERVSLIDGVNQIKISARSKLGKIVTENKTINASLAKKSDSYQISPIPIDGVEALVKITNQATWLIVQADGQDLFRGTVLPDTQQVFKAKNQLKITTGNAGNTQIFISNANIANKDLGRIGRPGEAKLDIEFNKDTQFGQ